MTALSRALAVLCVLLGVAGLVCFGVAPWVHGADCLRLCGTGLAVLVASFVAGVCAAVSSI